MPCSSASTTEHALPGLGPGTWTGSRRGTTPPRSSRSHQPTARRARSSRGPAPSSMVRRPGSRRMGTKRARQTPEEQPTRSPMSTCRSDSAFPRGRACIPAEAGDPCVHARQHPTPRYRPGPSTCIPRKLRGRLAIPPGGTARRKLAIATWAGDDCRESGGDLTLKEWLPAGPWGPGRRGSGSAARSCGTPWPAKPPAPRSTSGTGGGCDACTGPSSA